MKRQAHLVLQYLRARESSRSVNPHWATQFWNDVTQLAESEVLAPDLLRALQGAGYNGYGTVGAPRCALKSLLDAFASQAAPAHGAGWSQVETGANQAITLPNAETRWENQLPPDLPRAAPEIYRATRNGGHATVREWLSSNFKGQKSDSNPVWGELWNAASEIDFEVAQCADAASLNMALATSDSLENKLRRLASEEYWRRTGDRTGANMILAIKAPGISMDLAPKWLIDDVTGYSKAEHQRNERVAAAKRNRRGRGDGRGMRYQPGGDGQDAEAGRGGGGGRGGRRGGRA